MQPQSPLNPADRPPLTLVDSPASIRVVHDELDRLTRQVGVVLLRANHVLRTQVARSNDDGHRDALHLLARIEVLAEQIEHAKLPLRRMETRSAAPSFRAREAGVGH